MNEIEVIFLLHSAVCCRSIPSVSKPGKEKRQPNPAYSYGQLLNESRLNDKDVQ